MFWQLKPCTLLSLFLHLYPSIGFCVLGDEVEVLWRPCSEVKFRDLSLLIDCLNLYFHCALSLFSLPSSVDKKQPSVPLDTIIIHDNEGHDVVLMMTGVFFLAGKKSCCHNSESTSKCQWRDFSKSCCWWWKGLFNVSTIPIWKEKPDKVLFTFLG